MKGLGKAFGAFWYDFLIDDDWKIATYTVLALTAVTALAVAGVVDDAVLVLLGTVLLCVCFVLGVRYDARRMSR